MKLYDLSCDEDVRSLLNIRSKVYDRLCDVFEIEVDRDIYRCISFEYDKLNHMLFNIYSQKSGEKLFILSFNDFRLDISKIYVKNIEYLDKNLNTIKYSSLADSIIDEIFALINRLQKSLEE